VNHGTTLPPLEDEQGRALVVLARAVALAVASGAPEPAPGPMPDRLRSPQDAFVTLRVDGRLRGCIGVIDAGQPLDMAVRHCAAAAATSDPRFPPLRPEETARLAVEVSVLGPPRILGGPDEIVVGRDGLIVTAGPRRGLLLPSVAVEHGWDALRFLEETCRKAGLDRDAWRHAARVEAFRAQVFGEEPVEA
jgi:uncharacterized protein